jgi:hypothetical protein
VTAIEVRDDADDTDSLIEAIIRRLDAEDVRLRGEEWRASIDSPYALILRQWVGAEDDEPTGPRVRVTFTAHIEAVTEEGA